jgi:hypothetical protein
VLVTKSTLLSKIQAGMDLREACLWSCSIQTHITTHSSPLPWCRAGTSWTDKQWSGVWIELRDMQASVFPFLPAHQVGGCGSTRSPSCCDPSGPLAMRCCSNFIAVASVVSWSLCTCPPLFPWVQVMSMYCAVLLKAGRYSLAKSYLQGTGRLLWDCWIPCITAHFHIVGWHL